MSSLKEARKALGSSGKFPFSSKLCNSLPLAGLEAVSAVRVLMALLWIRDSRDKNPEDEHLFEVDIAELRSASGYGESGSYRQVLDGLAQVHKISFLTKDGEVVEIFDFVGLRETESGRTCCFRISQEFSELQSTISDDGYGMVDMEEIIRLARAIDLPIYLRSCAVRKRRRKVFDLSRAEVFCLSNRDPQSAIGGAIRAIKVSAARVGSVLKTQTDVEMMESLGRDRIKTVRISLSAL